jgi:hypothetical protein
VVALAITADRLGGGAFYFVGLVAAHLICQPIGRHVVVRCWVGFKRNTSRDGWSALQADLRHPVLYLRSFLVDDLLARTGETAMDYFRTEEERLPVRSPGSDHWWRSGGSASHFHLPVRHVSTSATIGEKRCANSSTAPSWSSSARDG